MSSTSHRTDTTIPTLSRTVAYGTVAGFIGSLLMAMFAMIAAATYQGSGFFTPLYHIGSVLLDPMTMMTSMEQAMSGASFYFAFGPAIVGMSVHILVGIVYGIVFALIVRAAKLRGTTLIIGGIVYGLIVFAVSAWVGLPLAAAITSSGEPIADMASMVGYGTFAVEHVLFGAAAALTLSAASRR